MKTALLLLAFLGQYTSRPPDVPLADPTPDFPLHVHLIAARWGADTMHLYRTLYGETHGGPGYYELSGTYHGFGSGNLLGDPPQGFDYTFDCAAPFLESRQPQDFYQARWKKPNQSLEILMQPIGSNRTDVCELDVAMKQHPFNPSLPPVIRSGNSLYASAFWTAPDVAFTGPAPDYPVHLHIIAVNRHNYERGSQGYGAANLLGSVPQGVDFNYDCDRSFFVNTQPGEFFEGHWVKPNERLEILLQRVGSDRVDRCQLRVSLKATPYPNSSVDPAPIQAPPGANRPALPSLRLYRPAGSDA